MPIYRVSFTAAYTVTVETEGDGPVDAQDKAVRETLALVREALVAQGAQFRAGAAVSFDRPPEEIRARRVDVRVVPPRALPEPPPLIRLGELLDDRAELHGPPEEIGTGLYRLVDGEVVGREGGDRETDFY